MGEVRDLIRIRQVRARTGLSTTAIYRRMSEGTFPRPIPLGGKCVAWIDTEVSAWIEERITAARPSPQEKTA